MYDRVADNPLYCLDTLDLVPYWCQKPTEVNGILVGEYNEGAKMTSAKEAMFFMGSSVSKIRPT